jgi:hypothetical protein
LEIHQNEDLLTELYRASFMGRDAMRQILPRITDSGLRREAQQQEIGYLTFLNRSQKLLKQENKPLHRPESWGKRAALWGSVQLNTLKDSSNGHLAEMMVNGINMGIVKMTKKLNDFPESGEETKHLTKNFLRQQEQQIENLKKYL